MSRRFFIDYENKCCDERHHLVVLKRLAFISIWHPTKGNPEILLIPKDLVKFIVLKYITLESQLLQNPPLHVGATFTPIQLQQCYFVKYWQKLIEVFDKRLRQLTADNFLEINGTIPQMGNYNLTFIISRNSAILNVLDLVGARRDRDQISMFYSEDTEVWHDGKICTMSAFTHGEIWRVPRASVVIEMPLRGSLLIVKIKIKC